MKDVLYIKKIIILNSSIRKKNTYSLLKKVEQKLSEFEIEFINISDYNIKPCIGCEVCIHTGLCSIKDDSNIILDKFKQADGIIIGAPVYLRQIPGLLKMLLDRACCWYHNTPIAGVPMLFVTTTGGSGTKQTVKYLEDVAIQFGAINCGSISSNLRGLSKKVILDKHLKKFKKYLSLDTLVKHRVSYKELIEFNTQKILALKLFPNDKIYWENKGYMNSPYYYKCKTGYIKRFIAFLYFKLLCIVIPNKIKDIEKSS